MSLAPGVHERFTVLAPLHDPIRLVGGTGGTGPTGVGVAPAGGVGVGVDPGGGVGVAEQAAPIYIQPPVEPLH